LYAYTYTIYTIGKEAERERRGESERKKERERRIDKNKENKVII